jgi:hypothetical protein
MVQHRQIDTLAAFTSASVSKREVLHLTSLNIPKCMPHMSQMPNMGRHIRQPAKREHEIERSRERGSYA